MYYDIYSHYGYGSELDDADIFRLAWLQECQNKKGDDEAVHELPEMFSAPELGIY